MDETFAFVAPVMPKRAVNPLAIRAGVIAALFVASVGALGVFVVEHEHAADAKRQALEARVAAAEQARVETLAGTVDVPTGIGETIDRQAQDAADESLGFVQKILRDGGSFADAGPAQLAALGSPLLFVDGPSTAPTIVSVATTDPAWAAAVAGPGACAWIMFSADGTVARETGDVCTGEAALGATGATW